MTNRLLKLPVVLALMVSIGLHWAFLQSVAWVGMVVNYSQEVPLGEALARTFDGQHPCELCHFVKEGQKAEKDRDILKPTQKVEIFLSTGPAFLFPTPPVSSAPQADPLPSPRSAPPSLPPPRLA